MILVPLDTPGVTVQGSTSVFGYDDAAHGGHGEITFASVRVPAHNLIGQPGSGFAIAQARLGPGRIHHCMRAIGMGERALELMASRVLERTAFGQPLARQGVIREWIAESRLALDQARLLVLKTAWLIDTGASRTPPVKSPPSKSPLRAPPATSSTVPSRPTAAQASPPTRPWPPCGPPFAPSTSPNPTKFSCGPSHASNSGGHANDSAANRISRTAATWFSVW